MPWLRSPRTPPPRQVRRAPGRRRRRRVPSPSPGAPVPAGAAGAAASQRPRVPVAGCPRVSPCVPVSPHHLPSLLCSLPGAAASDGAVSPLPEPPLFVRSFPRVPPAPLPGRGHPRPHPSLFQQNKKLFTEFPWPNLRVERWAGSGGWSVFKIPREICKSARGGRERRECKLRARAANQVAGIKGRGLWRKGGVAMQIYPATGGPDPILFTHRGTYFGARNVFHKFASLFLPGVFRFF